MIRSMLILVAFALGLTVAGQVARADDHPSLASAFAEGDKCECGVCHCLPCRCTPKATPEKPPVARFHKSLDEALIRVYGKVPAGPSLTEDAPAPPPAPIAAEEWRTCDRNPGIEVFGREIDGVFRYSTWRWKAGFPKPMAPPNRPRTYSQRCGPQGCYRQ